MAFEHKNNNIIEDDQSDLTESDEDLPSLEYDSDSCNYVEHSDSTNSDNEENNCPKEIDIDTISDEINKDPHILDLLDYEDKKFMINFKNTHQKKIWATAITIAIKNYPIQTLEEQIFEINKIVFKKRKSNLSLLEKQEIAREWYRLDGVQYAKGIIKNVNKMINDWTCELIRELNILKKEDHGEDEEKQETICHIEYVNHRLIKWRTIFNCVKTKDLDNRLNILNTNNYWLYNKNNQYTLLKNMWNHEWDLFESICAINYRKNSQQIKSLGLIRSMRDKCTEKLTLDEYISYFENCDILFNG